ncbi:1,4-dihydroxy-2-naphthoate octaprenyltransferase [Prevotella sp.]|uniref:1,4-dihydroxy-2-naphthoate octaprenyltransferase n=1 Tax=Prevotella sp. TaxID=59823 RepID=UPI00307CC617
MDNKDISRNSLKAWVLASRPKTLTGASVPVMIGLSLAWTAVGAEDFKLLPAVLCVLFAFIMQIDANFVNDYFDFVSGKDDEQRLGPARACAMGWIEIGKMRWGIIITTALACMVGLPLVLYGGMEMILVGALCVVFCFLYTTLLASHGFGDLLVLVFFGIVPVCATYYLQTATCTWMVFLASLACGLVIDTLLVVNNYRDIDNDRRAGKKTLIVMIGADNGRLLYLWLGIIASLMGVVFAVYGQYWTPLLPTVYMIMHIATYRRMVKIGKGRQLNLVLADTARNMFVYGLTVSLGLLLS